MPVCMSNTPADLCTMHYRVAAVNGALYILRQPVRKLLLDASQQRCQGVETESGQVAQLLLRQAYMSMWVAWRRKCRMLCCMHTSQHLYCVHQPDSPVVVLPLSLQHLLAVTGLAVLRRQKLWSKETTTGQFLACLTAFLMQNQESRLACILCWQCVVTCQFVCMQVIRCAAFAASSHLLADLLQNQTAATDHTAQPTQHGQQQLQTRQEQKAQKRISRAICILDGPLQVCLTLYADACMLSCSDACHSVLWSALLLMSCCNVDCCSCPACFPVLCTFAYHLPVWHDDLACQRLGLLAYKLGLLACEHHHSVLIA